MFTNDVYITGGMVPFNLCGGRGVISAGHYPLCCDSDRPLVGFGQET